jgi:hypothetical protein
VVGIYFVLCGGDIACFVWWEYNLFSTEYIYYTIFATISTTFLSITGKNSVRYYRKIIGTSSKVRDCSSGYKLPSA